MTLSMFMYPKQPPGSWTSGFVLDWVDITLWSIKCSHVFFQNNNNNKTLIRSQTGNLTSWGHLLRPCWLYVVVILTSVITLWQGAVVIRSRQSVLFRRGSFWIIVYRNKSFIQVIVWPNSYCSLFDISDMYLDLYLKVPCFLKKKIQCMTFYLH